MGVQISISSIGPYHHISFNRAAAGLQSSNVAVGDVREAGYEGSEAYVRNRRSDQKRNGLWGLKKAPQLSAHKQKSRKNELR